MPSSCYRLQCLVMDAASEDELIKIPSIAGCERNELRILLKSSSLVQGKSSADVNTQSAVALSHKSMAESY